MRRVRRSQRKAPVHTLQGMDGGPDQLARVLAVSGVILSVLALTWQLVSWRLGGARVKVEGRINLAPVEGGGEEEAFRVIARNKGRLPVSVTQWAVGICRGKWSPRRWARRPSWFTWKNWPEEWQGPDVPHTIAGHHSAEWSLRHADLIRALEQNEDSEVSLHATVFLATGRSRASREVSRWRPSSPD